MVSYEDRTGAEQRRAEREPWHIKQLRLFLKAAATESQRHLLRNKLTRARWDFYKTLAEKGAALHVARGGVVAKKRHLWPLQAVMQAADPPEVCQSTPKCLQLSGDTFQAKEGGTEQERDEFMCTLFNDLEISFSDTQTVLAVHACSKRDKLDHFGVCSQALCYAVISHSTAWARFFSKLASDHTWLQAVTVEGKLEAKAPGPITPENARSILPQPVLLQVLRNLLCGRIRAPLRARVKDPGCAQAIMGGAGGLREMDLLQPAQFFLEMSADNGSAWSMASGDIPVGDGQSPRTWF
jgi:hypothetical protein